MSGQLPDGGVLDTNMSASRRRILEPGARVLINVPGSEYDGREAVVVKAQRPKEPRSTYARTFYWLDVFGLRRGWFEDYEVTPWDEIA